MPEIELPRLSWFCLPFEQDLESALVLAVNAAVWATMFEPNDPEKRTEFVVRWAMMRRLNHLQQGPFPLPHRPFHKVLSEAFDIAYRSDLDRALHYGRITGETILALDDLIGNSPGRASLTAAQEIVRARLRQRGGGDSKSIVRDAWKEFSTVCHLWAAYLLCDARHGTIPFFTREFTVLAERLLNSAACWKHKNAISTVIDIETAWRIPHPWYAPDISIF